MATSAEQPPDLWEAGIGQRADDVDGNLARMGTLLGAQGAFQVRATQVVIPRHGFDHILVRQARRVEAPSQQRLGLGEVNVAAGPHASLAPRAAVKAASIAARSVRSQGIAVPPV